MTPRPPVRGELALPDLSPGQALWRGTVTALVVVLPAAIFNNVVVADLLSMFLAKNANGGVFDAPSIKR
mgnify:CR=1 FL=1